MWPRSMIFTARKLRQSPPPPRPRRPRQTSFSASTTISMLTARCRSTTAISIKIGARTLLRSSGRPEMITIRGNARHAHRVSGLIVGGILTTLLAIALAPARGHAQGGPGTIPTEPNLKVAIIGDSGNGADFRRVLKLIKSEGAHMVLHQGDFDYADSPGAFFATIDNVLGPDFPYLASVGNHDVESWREDCSASGARRSLMSLFHLRRADGCYATFLKTRLARLGVTPDDPNLDDQMYA